MTRVQESGEVCGNWPEAPWCLRVIDPDQTMRFDDIGKPPLHWCSACGPKARAMGEAIEQAINERPGFADKLREAIEQAEGGLQ